jgi:hypothetical protein
MVEIVKGAATEHGVVVTFKSSTLLSHLPLLDIIKSASVRSTQMLLIQNYFPFDCKFYKFRYGYPLTMELMIHDEYSSLQNARSFLSSL